VTLVIAGELQEGEKIVDIAWANMIKYVNLVGGLEHFLFVHILGMSSSQLTFIFFRGVGQPPTRNDDYNSRIPTTI